MTPDQPPNYGKPAGPPPPPPPVPPAVDTTHAAPVYGAPPVHQPQYYGQPQPQLRYTIDGVPLANTGIRVAARLIDFVLLSIVSFIGGMISSAALGSTFDYDSYRVASGLISLVVALASIAYFLIGESSFGTTVGKLILGLKVRSAPGGLMTLTQSLKRNAFVLPMYLAAAVSALLLLGSGQDLAGALTVLFYGGPIGILGTVATVGLSIAIIVSISNSPVLQGFHDKMADSTVVTTR